MKFIIQCLSCNKYFYNYKLVDKIPTCPHCLANVLKNKFVVHKDE